MEAFRDIPNMSGEECVPTPLGMEDCSRSLRCFGYHITVTDSPTPFPAVFHFVVEHAKFATKLGTFSKVSSL
jgi:hypothetical protein